MADQNSIEHMNAALTKEKIKRAMFPKSKIRLSDSLDNLVKTYSLKISEDGYISGDKYGFLRLSRDEEALPPDLLPNIIHGDIIFFLVPNWIDWPRHLMNHIFDCLPRAILDEGVITIPSENQDFFYAAGVADNELIEIMSEFLCFMAELKQVREKYRVDI